MLKKWFVHSSFQNGVQTAGTSPALHPVGIDRRKPFRTPVADIQQLMLPQVARAA
jgi:hypothetical protein